MPIKVVDITELEQLNGDGQSVKETFITLEFLTADNRLVAAPRLPVADAPDLVVGDFCKLVKVE